MTRMKQQGFTVIELLSVIVVLIAVTALFFVQKNDIETIADDDTRRTSINAMYYNLEDVYFKQNNYYPETINKDTLKAMDEELFKDPDGISIGTSGSSFHYDPTMCEQGKCSGYTLRAELEKEADFVKSNRNQ